MKTITIGFSVSNSKYSIFSRAICYVQKTPFSHVYTRFNWPAAGADIVYQASGLQVNFESFARFQSHSTPIAEFTFQVSDFTWHRIAAFMLNRLSRPYSVKSILGLFLKMTGIRKTNIIKDGPDAYVCSELAEDIGTLIGVPFKISSEESGPKEVYEALVAWRDANVRHTN